MLLHANRQPIYVKVAIPFQFPQMPPVINVMHRVTHQKITKDGSYRYCGEKVENWKSHSNLLALIRQLHQDFQMNPPVPENVVLAKPIG